jgi:calcineurin-like phosphoesterase family protein
MSNLWVISDTHFGHKNILSFSRPEYPTIEDHDSALIEAWNSVVKKGDRVLHLGDVAWTTTALNRSLQLLNGDKTLIMGNHDGKSSNYYLGAGFNSVKAMVVRDNVVFSHIPIHESELRTNTRWLANVHGHLHSNIIDDPRYFNVSVEHTDKGRPFHIDEIMDTFKKLEVLL